MSDRDQDRPAASSNQQRGAADAQRGYGDGGDTPFGQMAEGSSNRVEGGYGGDNAGGFGQQTMNSQWGQGGMGPMTQGAGYGQGGGQFGVAGRESQSGQTPFGSNPDRSGPPPQGSRGSYGQPDYSPAAQRSDFRSEQRYSGPGADTHAPPPHRDDHEHHYRNWREAQLSTHDRDYARWRDDQARKYDEDYHGWRSERHSAFSREFEGWRANRGGQSTGGQSTGAQSTGGQSSGGQSTGAQTTVDRSSETAYADPSRQADPNAAHGANPALADIADGHAGAHAHASRNEPERNDDQKR